MRRSLIMVAAAVTVMTVIPGVAAQDAEQTVDSQSEVFAPFVSRLRIAVADPRVRLSWNDSDDVRGAVRIYRHTEPITERTFPRATLVGTVEPGVEQFTDTPPAPGDYYYVVLASDRDGTEYELFLSYRNATGSPVAIANVPTPAEQAATVQSIGAELDDTQIEVRFSAPQTGRRLAVLRLNRPITTVEDVADAMTVATVRSSIRSVTDELVVPGVPYYYAAVDTEILADGEPILVAGQNTTAVPVELAIPEGAAQEVAVALPEARSLRRTPLPFLRLDASLSSGAQLAATEITIPDTQSINEVTDKALTVLATHLKARQTRTLEPAVLSQEQEEDLRGPEATLRSIVTGPYARMEWEETERLLTNFLTLPLADPVAARARFYRAVSLYFQNKPEAAFMEFLLAEQNHYAAVQPWLDAILDGLSG